MKSFLFIAATILGAAVAEAQQGTPLLPSEQVSALANELSGETAKRNLEGLARLHRQRGSSGFHAAAELIAERARAYGLTDVQILQLPADGKIFYGTQRSRPGWDAEEGELEELASLLPANKTCYVFFNNREMAEDALRFEEILKSRD